jgi:hypothetical protein
MAPFIDLSIRRSGNGILWVNSSHEDCKYVRKAERSAKTLNKFIEHADFALVSDRHHQDLDPVFDFQALANFYVP